MFLCLIFIDIITDCEDPIVELSILRLSKKFKLRIYVFVSAFTFGQRDLIDVLKKLISTCINVNKYNVCKIIL